MPVLGVNFPCRPARNVDSGICDDDVEAPQSGDAVDYGARYSLQVTHLGNTRHATSTAEFDIPCSTEQLVARRGGIKRDHICALVCEALTMHPSRAPGGAGDQHYLAKESLHRGILTSSKPG